jgi:hypothetical protein
MEQIFKALTANCIEHGERSTMTMHYKHLS